MSHIEAFSAYLTHERRYSVHTITAYMHDVTQFFSFIHALYGPITEAEVNAPMVKSYIYECMGQDMNPRSVNRKLTSLNSYYKYLMRAGLQTRNPLSSISGVKTSKRLYQWVEEKEMDNLLDQQPFFENTFEGQRDRLMIELLYGAGIRRAELIGLKTADADLKGRTVKVLGKRNKERIIPIPQSLCYTIAGYMMLRNEKGMVNASLLVTDNGDEMYPMFVQRKVKHYLGAVSRSAKTSPHVLRHSYATHLLNNGADINAIKELLGHQSLAATQVYTHNSIERLKTIYKQSHPKS